VMGFIGIIIFRIRWNFHDPLYSFITLRFNMLPILVNPRFNNVTENSFGEWPSALGQIILQILTKIEQHNAMQPLSIVSEFV
jgi:hypothetical protein